MGTDIAVTTPDFGVRFFVFVFFTGVSNSAHIIYIYIYTQRDTRPVQAAYVECSISKHGTADGSDDEVPLPPMKPAGNSQ